MKLTSIVLATSMALIPATATLANDAKKDALKKAKEAAKEKAIEAAKEKAKAKTNTAVAHAAAASSKTDDSAAKAEAARVERELHARNMGVLERLQQIATATNNSDLKVAVIRLNGKESRRHELATSL